MRVSANDPPVPMVPAKEPRPRPDSESQFSRDRSPSFGQVLRGLGREINTGEATMRDALGSMKGGSNLGAAELIALQAGVYRYSEAIDLASRLVDRATSGVKTVVQGGGQ